MRTATSAAILAVAGVVLGSIQALIYHGWGLSVVEKVVSAGVVGAGTGLVLSNAAADGRQTYRWQWAIAGLLAWCIAALLADYLGSLRYSGQFTLPGWTVVTQSGGAHPAGLTFHGDQFVPGFIAGFGLATPVLLANYRSPKPWLWAVLLATTSGLAWMATRYSTWIA